MAAWQASGLTVVEYCEGRAYTAKTLKWWASKLHRKQRELQASSALMPVKMARVVRVPSAPASAAGAIVVQVGSARVEVSNGSERATVTMVFEALGWSAMAGAQ